MNLGAKVLIVCVIAYAVVGVLVGLRFLLGGARRLLPAPTPMTTGALALLLPGAIVFWPLVLKRWVAQSAQGDKP